MEGCATRLAIMAQNEGAGGQKPVDGVEELCSVTSRTAVTTERGKRPIGTLRKGERVLAYNPQTHKMEMQPILHVWINHDHDDESSAEQGTHEDERDHPHQQKASVPHSREGVRDGGPAASGHACG